MSITIGAFCARKLTRCTEAPPLGLGLVGATMGPLLFGVAVGKVRPGLRVLPPVIVSSKQLLSAQSAKSYA